MTKSIKQNERKKVMKNEKSKFLVPQCLSALAPFPKSAFTLAEVLITLAIIGVVAAMTIPTLISNYQEKVTVTQLKKMYYTLSNAYRMHIAENGAIQADWTAEGAKKLFDAFQPHLRISKECGVSHEGCIINESYDRLHAERVDLNYGVVDTYYKARLSDGASIIFRGGDTRFGADGYIFYDINAQAGPNRWGDDMFEFVIKGEKLIPSGYPDDTENFDDHCAGADASGYGCAAWVIQKGNMDYIKCPGELTWSDKGCK